MGEHLLLAPERRVVKSTVTSTVLSIISDAATVVARSLESGVGVEAVLSRGVVDRRVLAADFSESLLGQAAKEETSMRSCTGIWTR